MKRIKQLSGSRLAIAITAVIVTTMVVAGGLAGALPGTRSVFTDDINTGAVNSRTIKNNNVKSKDIKNETIKSKDIRDGTITAADLSSDAIPDVPGSLWAKVDADPGGATLLAGSNVTAVGRYGIGVYHVTFDTEITDCAWVGSLIDLAPDGVMAVREIALEENNNPASTGDLVVRTFNSAGVLTEAGAQDGFAVMVSC